MATTTQRMDLAELKQFLLRTDVPDVGNLGGRIITDAKDQSLKGWCITAMIIGSLMVVVLGSIGIASLIQAHGIQIPHYLEWITPISQTPGASCAWIITICGTILGPILIAVGARKYHLLKNMSENDKTNNEIAILLPDNLQEAEWQELHEIIIPMDDLGYDPSGVLERLQDASFMNKTVYRQHFVEKDSTHNAFVIKTPNNRLLPTPLLPINDEKQAKLKDFMARLGYYTGPNDDKKEDSKSESKED